MQETATSTAAECPRGTWIWRHPGAAARMGCDGRAPAADASELFDVGPARAHLEGSVDSVSCPVCAFDERNRALHGYIQESLF